MDKKTIERFSRQMLVPGIGMDAQKAFRDAKVLIVGAGGLGCPVALYLGAAGVGSLRVCDADTVEASNLPRQILHKESSLGTLKAASIAESLRGFNSQVQVEVVTELVGPENVLHLMRDCQVVVDATDNVLTRYLLNDAAAICKIPLVSGAALGWQGQVSVFMFNATGPCYRCLYPTPPPPSAITNCDLGGVVGPVTGLVGSLQALQVLRILAGLPPACTDSLFTFDGDSTDRLSRQLRLRARNPQCLACGDAGTKSIHADGRFLIDYSFFCHGARADDKNPDLSLLEPEDRISAVALADLLEKYSKEICLIDVRPQNQFEFCRIPGSHSVQLEDVIPFAMNVPQSEIIVICRRGNDSQLAVQQLKTHLSKDKKIRDLIGGLRAWAVDIDPDMPVY